LVESRGLTRVAHTGVDEQLQACVRDCLVVISRWRRAADGIQIGDVRAGESKSLDKRSRDVRWS
jgi:hypothetical protein